MKIKLKINDSTKLYLKRLFCTHDYHTITEHVWDGLALIPFSYKNSLRCTKCGKVKDCIQINKSK